MVVKHTLIQSPVPCVYVESRRGYRPRKRREGTPSASETQAENISDLGDVTPITTTTAADSFEPELKKASSASRASASSGESVAQSTYLNRQNVAFESAHGTVDLVDLFYRSYFPAHGFMVPRKLLLQCPRIIPEELRAVMRFVGSQYTSNTEESLQSVACGILADEVSINSGFKVQGLLCLAMVFIAGRHERSLGVSLLEEAVEIALSTGMHRGDYSTKRLEDHPMLAESWRRTWWDLYVIDILLSALDGSNYKSRLHSVYSDVPLPGHNQDYNNCDWKPAAPTLAVMQDRTFADTPYPYSSGAYKVEAARILGTIINLESDLVNSANASVDIEIADASIQAFLLSLPPSSREVVAEDALVDEALFTTHMIIHWASILLHRPRSNLPFLRSHYRTAYSSDESVSMPALSLQSHTTKAIQAANAISQLTAIQTPPALHTPCFASAIALSATVHLPAYTLQTTNRGEIRERLRLAVSALNNIGEVWPLASVAREQIAQYARETFQAVSHPPAIMAGGPDIPIASDSETVLDIQNMQNIDSWLDELEIYPQMPLSGSNLYSGWM